MSNAEYLIESAVDMVREAKSFKQFSQIPQHQKIARQLNVSLNIVFKIDTLDLSPEQRKEISYNFGGIRC